MKSIIKIIFSIILIINLVSCAGNFHYYDVANSNESLNNQSQINDNTINNVQNISGNLEVFIKKVSIDDVEDGRTYQILEYPELSCTNDEYINDELNKLTNTLKNEVTDFKNDSKETVREMINTAEYESAFKDMEYAYTKEAEIVTNDGKYLSLLIKTYMYTGGAHPSYIISGYTYDVVNKKEANLYDLVNGKEELRQFLKDYAVKNKDDLYEDAEQTIDNYIDNPPNEFGIDYHIDYYIQNHELHVVFQAYELAPYAVGIIDIIVDKNLLKVDI